MYSYYLERKNFLAPAFYDKKSKILKDYITSIGQLEQKSTEWLNIRKTTIGGSEIGTLLGLNPYSNLRQLVAQKIGINEFRGNLATRWGCLFEDITRRWSQLVCGCKEDIIEIGGIEGIHARQRYSPDGLGIIPLKCETVIRLPFNKNNEQKEENRKKIFTREYFIALFEYKSPLRSMPNGKIPKHYYPQVQTGLLNVGVSEVGVFVNNCYRACSLQDLRNSASYYSKSLHSAKEVYEVDHKVLAHGIILFFVKKGEYVPIYDIIDYGARDVDTLSKLLYYYEKKTVIAYYAPISYISSDNIPYCREQGVEYPAFYADYHDIIDCAKKNENRFIGYLPWKLLVSDIILVSAQKNWRSIIEGPVNNALNIMDRIYAADNKEEAYRREFSCIVPIDKILEEISNPVLPDDWAGILTS